jgi:hypothetical protein
MAHSFLSLANLVTINDQNLADLQISDLLNEAPLLAALASAPASNGTEHKYVKETGAPVVGFRAANAGRDNSKSSDTLVTITLKILDASFAVDMALADAYKMGREAYIAREFKRHLKAAFFGAETQLINGAGTGGDAAGFVGLRDATTLDALADTMVTNAGGDTANACNSVFLIRTNEDGNDVTLISGNDAKIEMGDTVVTRLTDSDGKAYPGYYTPVTGWLGLQIGSAYSVGRICNLDSDHLLTDALIYEALAKFPAAKQPNLIVMNRTSLKALRASRTATNVTGAPAPRPTEVEGIPIITTDAILNTEAVVA